MAIVVVQPGGPAGMSGGVSIQRPPAASQQPEMTLWAAEFDGNQWHWSD